MPFQRTRVARFARSGSPLNGCPLDGQTLWSRICVLLAMGSCAPPSQPSATITVLVVNRSPYMLDGLAPRFRTAAGLFSPPERRLGALLPGGSVETLLNADQPYRIDVQVYRGGCAAISSGPLVAPGATYRAVVTGLTEITSFTTDYECHTRFVINGSIFLAGAV